MQQGRFDESIVELRMAERLDPLCAPTIGLIGVWFEGRGDEERALECTGRCSIWNPNPTMLTHL